MTDTSSERRWSRLCRFSSQREHFEAKLTTYTRLADHLHGAPSKEAIAIIEATRQLLQKSGVAKYDGAWVYLHELRGLFCLYLDLSLLYGSIIEDIRPDVEALPVDPVERDEPIKELNAIQEALLERIEEPELGGNMEQSLRLRLNALANRAAQLNEERWLNINLTRTRLTYMGTLLSIVVVIILSMMPLALSPDRTPNSIPYLLVIGSFGAVGGLVSALIGSEGVAIRKSDFYSRRRLLYMRPLIGAALSLVAYLALKAEVISVLGVNGGSPREAFIPLAFAAGFGERLIIRRLVQPSDEGLDSGNDDQRQRVG